MSATPNPLMAYGRMRTAASNLKGHIAKLPDATHDYHGTLQATRSAALMIVRDVELLIEGYYLACPEEPPLFRSPGANPADKAIADKLVRDTDEACEEFMAKQEGSKHAGSFVNPGTFIAEVGDRLEKLSRSFILSEADRHELRVAVDKIRNYKAETYEREDPAIILDDEGRPARMATLTTVLSTHPGRNDRIENIHVPTTAAVIDGEFPDVPDYEGPADPETPADVDVADAPFLDREIECSDGMQQPPAPDPLPQQPPTTKSYTGEQIRDIILKILTDSPKAMTPSNVRDALLSNGINRSKEAIGIHLGWLNRNTKLVSYVRGSYERINRYQSL